MSEGEEKKDYNPSTTRTPPPIGELKKALEECEKTKAEYLAGWQRERADFLNYKKEELERIGELIKYAGTGIILNILPILDNFEKAEREIPEDKKNDKFLKGVLQIKTQILDFLKKEGVEEMKIKIGEKFNPNFQEAVEMVKKENTESGIILEITQKGYTIHGRLLRPARVKIIK